MKWCAIFCGAYDNSEKTERTSWFCYGLGCRSKTRTLPENKTVVAMEIVEWLPPFCIACVNITDRDGFKMKETMCCSLLCCIDKVVMEDIEAGKRKTNTACRCIPCGSFNDFETEDLPRQVKEEAPVSVPKVVVEVKAESEEL